MRQLRFSMVAAAAALVVACGGGSSGTGGAPTGSQVGVLTDAQVQGVQYTTSSGLTGLTDADGRYSYNPGDTVTFRIGGVTLGQVPATGIVTPIQLAGGSTQKLTNLLILLQSLDADGNPANGLTIPAAATTALTAAIDLTAPLSGAATTAITSAMAAAGVQGSIKTASEAESHFLGQARSLMASNVWIDRDANGKPKVVLYFNADGYYVIGNFEAAADNGMPGFETGRVTATVLDANGFRLQAAVLENQNGEWGLSHAQADERFAVDGEKITVTDNIEQVTRSKMDNDSTGIVGAWRFADTSPTRSPATKALMLFFTNGYYAMVDTVGELESSDVDPMDICGSGGVELGRYAYNTTTKVVTPSAPEQNTNGCVGLFEGSPNPTTHTFTVSADGTTAVWQGSDGEGTWSVNLVRVSK